MQCWENNDVNETLFIKRKNDTGCISHNNGCDGARCKTDGECFLVQVPNSFFPTLLNATKECAEEVSNIFLNSWLGFQTNNTDLGGFYLFTVNHIYRPLIDPLTIIHTQMWKLEK